MGIKMKSWNYNTMKKMMKINGMHLQRNVLSNILTLHVQDSGQNS